MKKFLCVLSSVALSAVMLFTGCSLKGADGVDGRDGEDGQNVTIDDIYNKYVEENGETSFEDFLKEYLSYDGTELSNSASLKAVINRSLMCGVSILTRFGYSSSRPSTFPGHSSEYTTHKVYTGSGAILWMNKTAGDAYVVTNCHVIYDDTSDSVYSEDIRLYLYGQDTAGVNFQLSNSEITGDDNYRINAEIAAACANYDIALLKVTDSAVLKRSNATAISNKSNIAEAIDDSFVKDVFSTVGETVFAVGNASGEGMSASNGIISKDSEYIDVGLSDKNTDATYNYRVLRTTAPINHGNSGGGLFNTSGKLVGIINAKDQGEDIDNMGYALPANMVRRILVSMYDSYVANGNKMISSGSTKGGIKKAYLNIETQVTDSYSYLNEQGIAEIRETVKVASTLGKPSTGVLEVGDVIVSAKLTDSAGTVKENLAITRNYCLSEMLMSARAGDTLYLTIERNKAEKEVSIKFESNYFKYFE